MKSRTMMDRGKLKSEIERGKSMGKKSKHEYLSIGHIQHEEVN